MRLDPTNMPFGRAQPYQQRTETGTFPALAGAPGMPGMPGIPGAETALRAESILLEEFDNAGVAAYQAKQDSANLFNLYLLAAGALATGFGVLGSSYNESNKSTVVLVEVLLLGIAAVLSFAFFARNLDLGREYRENLIAMNLIKEFYIANLAPRMPHLERAFHRRLRDVPRQRPLGIGASVMTVTIALLGAAAVGGTVGQARQLWAIATNGFAAYTPELRLGGIGVFYAAEIGSGLLALLAQYLYYRYATRAHAQVPGPRARG
jgi:hypothetical protein